jgi:hypothetical protein
MKKVLRTTLLICLLVIICIQQVQVFKLKVKLDAIYTNVDHLKCRVMDNSERMFYIEETVGCSYGESGEN